MSEVQSLPEGHLFSVTLPSRQTPPPRVSCHAHSCSCGDHGASPRQNASSREGLCPGSPCQSHNGHAGACLAPWISRGGREGRLISSVPSFCAFSFEHSCAPLPGRAQLSASFSRQEHWSGLPFPTGGTCSPRDRTQVSCFSCFGRWVLYCSIHSLVWPVSSYKANH